MKNDSTFKDFLFETEKETSFQIDMKDGSSFTIKAPNVGDAKAKATKRLKPGQRIVSVKKDVSAQKDVEEKAAKLKSYIKGHVKLRKDPGKTASLLRSLGRATTVKAVNAVSDSMNEFLKESEEVVVEGGDGSGRPDDGKRPRKSLWFRAPNHWYSDLHNTVGADNFNVVKSDGAAVELGGDGTGGMSGGEAEELSGEDLYAVDKSGENCYGCWRHGYKKGITFEKPRPLKLVKQTNKL